MDVIQLHINSNHENSIRGVTGKIRQWGGFVWKDSITDLSWEGGGVSRLSSGKVQLGDCLERFHRDSIRGIVWKFFVRWNVWIDSTRGLSGKIPSGGLSGKIPSGFHQRDCLEIFRQMECLDRFYQGVVWKDSIRRIVWKDSIRGGGGVRLERFHQGDCLERFHQGGVWQDTISGLFGKIPSGEFSGKIPS